MEEQRFRIDINKDYCITADSMQYVVCSKRISDGQKTKGEEALSPEAYLGTLNQCLKWIVDRELRLSDARSFNDLINVLNRVNEEILKVCTVNEIKTFEGSRVI